MCDFSLQSVRSRPAQVGDKLVTQDFGTGTRGFAAADDRGLAVCVLPGTELAFAGDVACLPAGLLGWKTKTINHQTAIFRQVNKDKMAAHHDALEFPDGTDGHRTAIASQADHRGRSAGAGTGQLRRLRRAGPIGLSSKPERAGRYPGGRLSSRFIDGRTDYWFGSGGNSPVPGG
jgi:hypothetical protein